MTTPSTLRTPAEIDAARETFLRLLDECLVAYAYVWGVRTEGPAEIAAYELARTRLLAAYEGVADALRAATDELTRQTLEGVAPGAVDSERDRVEQGTTADLGYLCRIAADVIRYWSEPSTMERADVDQLLKRYERACAAVVEQGDSHLSETTRVRAMYRDEVRALLLRPASTARSEPTTEGVTDADVMRALCLYHGWASCSIGEFDEGEFGEAAKMRDVLEDFAARSPAGSAPSEPTGSDDFFNTLPEGTCISNAELSRAVTLFHVLDDRVKRYNMTTAGMIRALFDSIIAARASSAGGRDG